MTTTITKTERHTLKKEMTIARILKNDTYTDESSLVVALKKALRKMSVSDLSNLEVIILCKVGGAMVHAAEVTKRDRKEGFQPDGSWVDFTTYHAPKGLHPATCSGCTSNSSKHGKEVGHENL